MLSLQRINCFWWQSQTSTTSTATKAETVATVIATKVITTIKNHQQLSNKQNNKDYVIILTTVIILLHLCCKNSINSITSKINQKHFPFNNNNSKTAVKMGDRLNIGREVRELKLGSTFNPQNSQTAFHTIKYDFKPASVDLNRVATVDVGSNNQVTVTVPNLESSGVPHTVFKGNQRKYTKECLLIFDRKTGTVTLERLNHNIQVKKTRSETQNKAPPLIPPNSQKFENNTQRTSSKTRVSTGSRKNNIIGFVPRNSPMQQGSPSSYSTHKSPQTSSKCKSSRWNANNAQSTLPSIPMIEVDDDMTGGMTGNVGTVGSSGSGNNNGSSSSSNSLINNAPPSSMMIANTSDYHHPQPQSQQYHNQQNHNSISHMNSGNNGLNAAQSSSTTIASSSLASAPAALQPEIGVLSSSDSTSDSDSSGSGSDSDDSVDDTPQQRQQQQQQQQQHQRQQNQHQQKQTSHQQQQPVNPYQTYANGSFPALLLHDDLQLSESCSDSDDD